MSFAFAGNCAFGSTSYIEAYRLLATDALTPIVGICCPLIPSLLDGFRTCLLSSLNTRPFRKLPRWRRSQFEQFDRRAVRPLPTVPTFLPSEDRAGEPGLPRRGRKERHHVPRPPPADRVRYAGLRLVTAGPTDHTRDRRTRASHTTPCGRPSRGASGA